MLTFVNKEALEKEDSLLDEALNTMTNRMSSQNSSSKVYGDFFSACCLVSQKFPHASLLSDDRSPLTVIMCPIFNRLMV